MQKNVPYILEQREYIALKNKAKTTSSYLRTKEISFWKTMMNMLKRTTDACQGSART
jgi:hypothetical protein